MRREILEWLELLSEIPGWKRVYYLTIGNAGVMPGLVEQTNQMILQFNANALDKNELFWVCLLRRRYLI